MGGGPIRCFIGFSTENVSPLTAELEQHGARMELRFRKCQDNLLAGFGVLHDAVDAALDGDGNAADRHLDHGLARLEACNLDLAAIGESLAHSRRRLADTAREGKEEPLVARERFFSGLDYQGIYGELLAAGAAIPGKVYWEEVIAAVRTGGASGGLRLLEKTLRRIQTEVRSYAAQAAHMRDRPLADLARGLHGMTTRVAAILTQWSRFLTYATYLNVVCERATQAHEMGGQEREGLSRGA